MNTEGLTTKERTNVRLALLAATVLLFGAIDLILSFYHPENWPLPMSTYFVASIGLICVFSGAIGLYLLSLPSLGVEETR
jgi:uncharacterized membrane protein